MRRYGPPLLCALALSLAVWAPRGPCGDGGGARAGRLLSPVVGVLGASCVLDEVSELADDRDRAGPSEEAGCVASEGLPCRRGPAICAQGTSIASATPCASGTTCTLTDDGERCAPTTLSLEIIDGPRWARYQEGLFERGTGHVQLTVRLTNAPSAPGPVRIALGAGAFSVIRATRNGKVVIPRLGATDWLAAPLPEYVKLAPGESLTRAVGIEGSIGRGSTTLVYRPARGTWRVDVEYRQLQYPDAFKGVLIAQPFEFRVY